MNLSDIPTQDLLLARYHIWRMVLIAEQPYSVYKSSDNAARLKSAYAKSNEISTELLRRQTHRSGFDTVNCADPKHMLQ